MSDKEEEFQCADFFIKEINKTYDCDYIVSNNTNIDDDADIYAVSKKYPKLYLQIVAVENVQWSLAKNRKKALKEGKANIVSGDYDYKRWITKAMEMKENHYSPDDKKKLILLLQGCFPTLNKICLKDISKDPISSDFRGIYYVSLPANVIQTGIDTTSLRKGYVFPFKDAFQHVVEVRERKKRGKARGQSSTLYRLEGEFSEEELQGIARELLCDPVTEEFAIDNSPKNRDCFFADVWFKSGVTDSVGESVLKAIKDLKISCVKKAFSGRRYEFKAGTKNRNLMEDKIREVLEKQVMNPLIQECKIRHL